MRTDWSGLAFEAGSHGMATRTAIDLRASADMFVLDREEDGGSIASPGS